MAITTSLTFYAAATSTGGDGVCQVIIPTAGRIVAISLCQRTATAAGVTSTEVSLQSTNQFITNDARNVLLSFVGDSGNANIYTLPFQAFMDVPVTEMDRVYVHIALTSAQWRLTGQVWLRH